ncbi:MAG: hypothetical protein ACLPT4_08795 [Verrucomicrobiia bacterium]
MNEDKESRFHELATFLHVAKRGTLPEESERARANLRAFVEANPEYRDKAKQVEALPADADLDAIDRVMGYKPLLLSVEDVEAFADRLEKNRETFRLVQPKGKRGSNARIVKRLRSNISFRDKYRKDFLAKWEQAMPKNPETRKKYFAELLKREGITEQQARTQSGLRHDAYKHLHALDTYDTLLIGLAEKYNVNLCDLEAALISPRGLKEAQEKLAQDSPQEAEMRGKVRRLNLRRGASLPTPDEMRRVKAMQKIRHVPSRKVKRVEAKAVGIELGEHEHTHQPYATKMMLKLKQILGRSRLPKRLHNHTISNVLSQFWRAYSPDGISFSLTADIVRFHLRKAKIHR